MGVPVRTLSAPAARPVPVRIVPKHAKPTRPAPVLHKGRILAQGWGLLDFSEREPGGSPSVLSLEGAAGLLSIPAKTIARLVDKGEVPHYRVDGVIFFKSNELLDCLRIQDPRTG